MRLRLAGIGNAAKAAPIIVAVVTGFGAGAVGAGTDSSPLAASVAEHARAHANLRLAQAITTNISGSWFDAQLSSSKIAVVQNGNEFSFMETGIWEDNPLIGVGFDWSGEGHVNGNALDMNFSFRSKTNLSVTGHCSGVLRKDGVIAWHCKDSNAFETKPTWIRQ